MDKLQEIKRKFIDIMNTMNEPVRGVSDTCIEQIEKSLNISLPEDFRFIASFFDGGISVGNMDFLDFEGDDDYSITGETLRIREAIDLPQRMVVISESPESIVLLDTQNTPAVIWCDATDIENIDNSDFESDPDLWDSFADFFDEMLSDENDD